MGADGVNGQVVQRSAAIEKYFLDRRIMSDQMDDAAATDSRAIAKVDRAQFGGDDAGDTVGGELLKRDTGVRNMRGRRGQFLP